MLRRLALPLLLVCLAADRALPQPPPEAYLPRTANAAEIGVNALVGGVTAAIRAWTRHGDIPKAFAYGALGGGVHLGGKALMARTSVSPWAGLVVSSVGISMVANAGEGQPLFGQVTVPVGFARVRLRPQRQRPVTLAVNLMDAGTLAWVAAHPDITFDARRSLRTGTFVFSSGEQLIRINGDQEVAGMELGPAIVVSTHFPDQDGLLVHELVHVHQFRYLQGVVDPPLERRVRPKVPVIRRLPSWIELGIFSRVVSYADETLFDEALRGLAENEAEILSRIR